ncbi:MAG TPA: 16S rRNA (uracil(1498)-N(3))-methyltransferase [Firmicutes bacterium]|nr:16S rRNA (uracil(1498)-N(3))-methyltransferase [Candidatus Fermentithermobacillaceae bacterium]
MTLYRFFIDQSMIRDGLILLSGDPGKHARVVRLKPGEIFEAVTPGFLYSATVESTSPQGVTGRVVSVVPVTPPNFEVHLFAGMIKASKMDLVVEKATELGVTSITPVICSRSVPNPDESGWERKVLRWRRIALSAAEQSKRTSLPEIRYPLCFEDLTSAESAHVARGKLILAWEGLSGTPSDLGRIVAGERRVSVLVGPEGGFSDSEVEAALSRGFIPVSLGPHLLPAETACIMAVGLVVFVLHSLTPGSQ